MARLDPIIERIFKEQGFEASFETGTPGVLRTATGEKALFKLALTTPQIVTAFSEIAPPELRATFPPEGTSQFAYASALGGVQIKIDKQNGTIRAQIMPKLTGPTATAPRPTAQPPVPATSAPAAPTASAHANVKVSRPREPRAQMDELLRVMIAKRASDVHCSSDNCPMLRIDGSMEPLTEWGVLNPEDLKAPPSATRSSGRRSRTPTSPTRPTRPASASTTSVTEKGSAA